MPDVPDFTRLVQSSGYRLISANDYVCSGLGGGSQAISFVPDVLDRSVLVVVLGPSIGQTTVAVTSNTLSLQTLNRTFAAAGAFAVVAQVNRDMDTSWTIQTSTTGAPNAVVWVLILADTTIQTVTVEPGYQPLQIAPTPTGAAAYSVNLAQVGGAGILLGQVAMAQSVPVALASDQMPSKVSSNGQALPTPLGFVSALGWMLNAAGGGVDLLREPVSDTQAVAGLLAVAPSAYNGTTYDRLRTTQAGGLSVSTRKNLLNVVATSAANAAVTVTLAAPGAGLYQHITHLRIVRVCTAAVAGGATLAITTTNLGGLGYLAGNAIAAGATLIDMDSEWATPLRANVANTAVTLVFPAAGATVQWHVAVFYYLDSIP